jgi:glutamine synthetase
MLAAGLEGIANEYPLSAPTEENVFELAASDRKARGIEVLPGSLKEAIEAFAQSDFARRALGDHVFESLLQNKTIEYDQYRRYVTDYELDRYLAVL